MANALMFAELKSVNVAVAAGEISVEEADQMQARRSSSGIPLRPVPAVAPSVQSGRSVRSRSAAIRN